MTSRGRLFPRWLQTAGIVQLLMVESHIRHSWKQFMFVGLSSHLGLVFSIFLVVSRQILATVPAIKFIRDERKYTYTKH